MIEISSRKTAINNAILNGKSDEVLIVAGKGHENVQEYNNKKYFSDRDTIINSIKLKNNNLSNDWKLNIFKEFIKDKKISKLKKFELKNNSKKINNNKIFFDIKSNSFDGNDFADEAIKNGAKVAIVQKAKNNLRKIKVKNSLNLLTNIAKKVRISSNSSFVAITGSSGKTS